MEQELDDEEWFVAIVENAERISWTEQDYRDTWNAEFPDDPIED